MASSGSGEKSLIRDDGHETRAAGDNFDAVSGEHRDSVGDRRPRKKYQRHSARQIQELEKFFKDCRHPDEHERMELSRRVGLESRQIKFWFQNKRTQAKTKSKRRDNVVLRQENQELKRENQMLKDSLKGRVCSYCGGAAVSGEITYLQQQIKIENDRLSDELASICSLLYKFLVGRNGGAARNLLLALDYVEGPLMRPVMENEILYERSILLDLALAATDELLKMAHIDNPLWTKSRDGRTENLNHDEYQSIFAASAGMKHHAFLAEASRETGVVIIDSSVLIEVLMDANRWTAMFPSIIARAMTIDVISGGTGWTRDGALQVMEAEFQMLSPLVPTRQTKFLRFCKYQADGVWAVVDVSIGIDQEDPYNGNCKRLPSGCIIQDAPNGCSKVTWVEHSEYDETLVHGYYRQMIHSGLGFGAQRWIASLRRNSDHFATITMAPTPNQNPTELTAAGAKSILKLTERLTVNYYAGISASSVCRWDNLLIGNVDADTRILTRTNFSNPGEPRGVILNAATSLWMPVTKQRLFDLLTDGNTRRQWDILSEGGLMQEIVHFDKSLDKENTVSLLRSNAVNGTESNMMILQETWNDASGAVIVYAPVDVLSMEDLLKGRDSAYMPILPSGFAILPDGSPEKPANRTDSGGNFARPKAEGNTSGGGCEMDAGGGDGCLMTVGFQILVSSDPTVNLNMESVERVNNLLASTVEKIKAAIQ